MIVSQTSPLCAIIGPRGTGKTQMATELCYEAIDRAVAYHGTTSHWYKPLPYTPARYTKAIDIFMDIKSSYRKGSTFDEKEVIERYCRPHLLFIDEISVRGESKWEDDIFTEIVDKRYERLLTTFLLGNLTPTELAANVGASIASRIGECGGLIVCDWPSFRVKEPA